MEKFTPQERTLVGTLLAIHYEELLSRIAEDDEDDWSKRELPIVESVFRKIYSHHGLTIHEVLDRAK